MFRAGMIVKLVMLVKMEKKLIRVLFLIACAQSAWMLRENTSDTYQSQ